MQKSSRQIHFFDRFALDLTRGCLLRGHEEIKLRPKSFEVLKYLVGNSGRLINKDELIHAVWVDASVTDDSLVQCLKDIRHALCDEAQQIIKTVHGRGYIFDTEVREEPFSHAGIRPGTEEDTLRNKHDRPSSRSEKGHDVLQECSLGYGHTDGKVKVFFGNSATKRKMSKNAVEAFR